MRSYPDHKYQGYTIVIKVFPASDNRYQAGFSVHLPSVTAQHVPPGSAIPFRLEYQEGREHGASCETAADARQNAIDRAIAWIDARPVETGAHNVTA